MSQTDNFQQPSLILESREELVLFLKCDFSYLLSWREIVSHFLASGAIGWVVTVMNCAVLELCRSQGITGRNLNCNEGFSWGRSLVPATTWTVSISPKFVPSQNQCGRTRAHSHTKQKFVSCEDMGSLGSPYHVGKAATRQGYSPTLRSYKIEPWSDNILSWIHSKFLLLFLSFVFWVRASLCNSGQPWTCSPGWPWTHNPPASTSPMLWLQVCTTTPCFTQ
jgi:hypothetical protein